MGLVMGLGLLQSVDSLRYHGKSGIWLEVVGVHRAIDIILKIRSSSAIFVML